MTIIFEIALGLAINALFGKYLYDLEQTGNNPTNIQKCILGIAMTFYCFITGFGLVTLLSAL